MTEEKYFVLTHSINGWRGISRDSGEIFCDGVDKGEVLDCIIRKAKQAERSRVLVHTNDGELLEEKVFSGGEEL